MTGTEIHWAHDAWILLKCIYVFVFAWVGISWFSAGRPPIRLPREQFLHDQIEQRAITHQKRAA